MERSRVFSTKNPSGTFTTGRRKKLMRGGEKKRVEELFKKEISRKYPLFLHEND